MITTDFQRFVRRVARDMRRAAGSIYTLKEIIAYAADAVGEYSQG